MRGAAVHGDVGEAAEGLRIADHQLRPIGLALVSWRRNFRLGHGRCRRNEDRRGEGAQLVELQRLLQERRQVGRVGQHAGLDPRRQGRPAHFDAIPGRLRLGDDIGVELLRLHDAGRMKGLQHAGGAARRLVQQHAGGDGVAHRDAQPPLGADRNEDFVAVEDAEVAAAAHVGFERHHRGEQFAAVDAGMPGPQPLHDAAHGGAGHGDRGVGAPRAVQRCHPQLLEVIVGSAGDAAAEAAVPARLGVVDLGIRGAGAVPHLDGVDADRAGVVVGRAIAVQLAVIRVRRAPGSALGVRVPQRLLHDLHAALPRRHRALHDAVDGAQHRRVRAAVGFLARHQQQLARLPQRIVLLVVGAVIGQRHEGQPHQLAFQDLPGDGEIAGGTLADGLAQEAAVGGMVVVNVRIAVQPLQLGRLRRRYREGDRTGQRQEAAGRRVNPPNLVDCHYFFP